MRKQGKTIFVILGLCLLLTACGKEEKPAPEAEKAVYDDSFIEEIVREGEYEEKGWLEKMPYSYHVPQLKADTEDAKEINAELAALADIEKSTEPLYCDRIRWDSHWNGSLLSLLVTTRVTDLGTDRYTVYNYDFETGEELSEEDLLRRAGVTENEAEAALRRAAAQYFDRESGPLLSMETAGYWDLRVQTISEDNLDLDEAQLFLNNDGKLCTPAAIMTPAGGGYYTVILLLSFDGNGVDKKADCEFASATLKNGREVTLEFRKEDLAEILIPPCSVQYGRAYPVEGLYGNYTDLALGFMGNGGCLYLFLLDDGGRVTVCSLTDGLLCGPRFVAAGPLPIEEKVKSIEFLSDEDGSTAEAVLEDGSRICLQDAVTETENALHYSLRDTTWVEEDSGVYSLTAGEDEGGLTLRWSGTNGDTASGYMSYLGMTEEGLVYGWNLPAGAGASFGTLTLTCNTVFFGPAEENTLTIERTDGEDLQGLDEDGEAELIRFWG